VWLRDRCSFYFVAVACRFEILVSFLSFAVASTFVPVVGALVV